jgi:hypothetical protein
MRRTISIFAVVALAISLAAQTGGKAPKRFVISDFGAVTDAATVNTKAIQAAIDKCAASGRGVVVVPKARFSSGAIFLKQGVNLAVEKDGVLEGTTNIDDYPVIDTRWEGTIEPWTSAFVNAGRMTDLEISGEGTIDGSGEEWLQKYPPRRPGDSPSPAQPSTQLKRGKPPLIGIQNSKRVRVAGLNLHNQAIWCLFVLCSEDVLAERNTIFRVPTASISIPPGACASTMCISTSTTIAFRSSREKTPTVCASIARRKILSSRTPTLLMGMEAWLWGARHLAESAISKSGTA